MEVGGQAEVVLAGAPRLSRSDPIAEQVLPTGIRRLVELMERAIQNGLQVHT